jgi:hypothetical protein
MLARWLVQRPVAGMYLLEQAKSHGVFQTSPGRAYFLQNGQVVSVTLTMAQISIKHFVDAAGLYQRCFSSSGVDRRFCELHLKAASRTA